MAAAVPPFPTLLHDPGSGERNSEGKPRKKREWREDLSLFFHCPTLFLTRSNVINVLKVESALSMTVVVFILLHKLPSYCVRMSERAAGWGSGI